MKDKKIKPLKKANLEQELTALREQLLRSQADFENYRKRTQKEKEDFGAFLNADLIMRILPTLDNFRLALKHLPVDLSGNDWVAGVWQIEKQLSQVLTEEGLVPIVSVGQKFDHNLHEAIEEVATDKPPGTIVDEVLAGYKLKDRVIRPAKVRVSGGDNKDNKKNVN